MNDGRYLKVRQDAIAETRAMLGVSDAAHENPCQACGAGQGFLHFSWCMQWAAPDGVEFEAAGRWRCALTQDEVLALMRPPWFKGQGIADLGCKT